MASSGGDMRMPHINSGVASPSKVPFRKPSKFCQHNGPNAPTYMTKARKTCMEQIKKREEIRATRHKLKAILMQKLCKKFKNVGRDQIEKCVNEFVTAKMDVTSEELINLENKIQGLLPSNHVSNKSTESINPANDETRNENPEKPETVNAIDPLYNPAIKDIEWDALQTLQNIKHEESQKKEWEKQREKKRQMRLLLDQQMKEASEIRRKIKQEDDDYFQHVTRNLEKFKLEEESNHKRIHDYQESERLRHKMYMEEERKRKEEELRKRQMEEQADLERIAKAMAYEQKLRQERKEEEARRHQAILKENEENNRRRALMRQKEIEENEEIMRQYAARLDAEAAAREAAFKKRMETLEKFAKWADDEGPGKAKREEERKFEELLLKEQQKKEEKDRQREIKEANDRLNRLRKMKEENLKQIEERTYQYKKEKESEHELSLKQQEETLKFKQQELEKQRQLKEQQKKQSKILKEQMTQRKQAWETMNDTERRLNSDDLRTLVSDNLLQSRVYHRLRLGSAQGKRPSTAGAMRTNPIF